MSSGSSFDNYFRINMGEYYLIDDDGLYRKITPRPNLLFEDSSLIIVSAIDRKIYNLTGNSASEKKKEAAATFSVGIGARYGFTVEDIIYPTENVKPEHIQFIEYFVDDLYLPRIKIIESLKYSCYHCSEQLDRIDDKCYSCGKDLMTCFVCNLPLSHGEDLGKCNLCGATAHLVHFQEWIKSLGMCTKCNQKLPLEGIIPITKENRDKYF